MSVGYETLDIVEPWLISVLKPAVVTTGLVNAVINGQTTENIQAPYLYISLTSSRDIRGVGPTRLDTDSLYLVKAVHRTNSFAPGRAVMGAVDLALQGKVVTTASGNLTCVRELSVHYPETLDGAQYMHVGASYRIRAASD